MKMTVFAAGALLFTSPVLAQGPTAAEAAANRRAQELEAISCVKAAAIDLAAKTEESASVIARIALKKCDPVLGEVWKTMQVREYGVGEPAAPKMERLKEEASTEAMEAVIEARAK